MTAAKHTPGPWTVNPLHGGQVARVWNGRPVLVAYASMTLPWHEDIACEAREVGANADLIAVAPEMLDALGEMLELIDDLAANIRYTDRVQTLEASWRALKAKATGGAQ